MLWIPQLVLYDQFFLQSFYGFSNPSGAETYIIASYVGTILAARAWIKKMLSWWFETPWHR